jgi:hypothetical protein
VSWRWWGAEMKLCELNIADYYYVRKPFVLVLFATAILGVVKLTEIGLFIYEHVHVNIS